jgi:hypothetical protein
MKTINEHIGELNQLLKKSEIDTPNITCLFPDCKNKAIYSHSIQENGVLDILEANIPKKGIKIYSIEDYPEIDFSKKKLSTHFKVKRQLNDFSKNRSSGFHMFCNEHDKKSFTEIEDFKYEATYKQFFLHAIRAYLFDTRRAELFYAFAQNNTSSISDIPEALSDLNNLLPKLESCICILPDEHIITEEEAVALGTLKENSIFKVLNRQKARTEFENVKFAGKTGAEVKNRQVFNFIAKLLDKKSTNSFEYKSWTLKTKIPIAGSFVVRSTDKVISTRGFLAENTPVFSFTVFPLKYSTETIIILSSLLKAESKTFFSKLNMLSDSDLQFAFSNIIMQHGTNTFISPRMWEKLTEYEKNYFLKSKTPDGYFSIDKLDYTINLFSEKFHE